LYRQAQILARQGIAIDRATLAFWTGYGAAEIKPVWRLMLEELLSSTKLFVDETTAPVLDPGRRWCTVTRRGAGAITPWLC
jgi:transposase